MHIVTTAAGAALALALIGGAALPAHAEPPRHTDHVSCFIRALPPAKAREGALAPISYGYALHCTPHAPTLIGVTVKLWRFDFNRLEAYEHSGKVTMEPEYDKDVRFYASCSGAPVRYSFHTEAILGAMHGNIDGHTDNSESETLEC